MAKTTNFKKRCLQVIKVSTKLFGVALLLLIIISVFLLIWRFIIIKSKLTPYKDGVQAFDEEAKLSIVYNIFPGEDGNYLHYSPEPDGKLLLKPQNYNWVEEGLQQKGSKQYSKACKFKYLQEIRFISQEAISQGYYLGAALYSDNHSEEEKQHIEEYLDSMLIVSSTDPLLIKVYNLFH